MVFQRHFRAILVGSEVFQRCSEVFQKCFRDFCGLRAFFAEAFGRVVFFQIWHPCFLNFALLNLLCVVLGSASGFLGLAFVLDFDLAKP